MKGIKRWGFSYRKKVAINGIIAFLLCVSLIAGIIPITQKVYAADDKQYVVLVLDTAGNTNFMKSENEIAYSAVSPINDVKEAAKGFIESVIASNRNAYVSIISYSDSATLVSDFVNNG